MSKGTLFWILLGVVVFISRVFVSTEMMMATPMMQHTPNATTTPALAVEVGGSSLLFVFKVLKFFFFVVVVYVVVFRDWIFGYERWLCLDDDLFSIGCKARLALT